MRGCHEIYFVVLIILFYLYYKNWHNNSNNKNNRHNNNRNNCSDNAQQQRKQPNTTYNSNSKLITTITVKLSLDQYWSWPLSTNFFHTFSSQKMTTNVWRHWQTWRECVALIPSRHVIRRESEPQFCRSSSSAATCTRPSSRSPRDSSFALPGFCTSVTTNFTKNFYCKRPSKAGPFELIF